jgi:acyl transferase domain-containing protein/acyl carrier protein
MARRITSGGNVSLITATLPHKRDRRGALAHLQRALGQLWLAGTTPDWAGYYRHEQRRRIALPTYVFEPRRYWLEPQPLHAPAVRRPGPHPLLDEELVRTMGEAVFRTDLSIERHWVLGEHRLLGEGIVPGTTYLEMGQAAVSAYTGRQVGTITEVDFFTPLLVRQDAPREVHTRVRELDEGTLEFTIVSHDPGSAAGQEWTEHARGQIGTGPPGQAPRQNVDDLRGRCAVTSADGGRSQADHRFMQFGPRWRKSLGTIRVGVGCAFAALRLPPEFQDEGKDYTLHPALLDLATGISGFAVLGPDAAEHLAKQEPELFLPVGYDRIEIHGAIPARGYSFARPHPRFEQRGQLRKVDVLICDETGTTMVDIRGFTAKRVNDPQRTVRELDGRGRHHGLRWVPLPPEAGNEQIPGGVLVIQDNERLSGGLIEVLRARGARVVEARLGAAWSQAGADLCHVPPTAAGYERLLAQFDGEPPGHIVYMAAKVDDDAHRDHCAVTDYLDRGLHSLFELAKVLGGQAVAGSRLTVVAPCVSQVTGHEPGSAPVHSALFGLANVMGQEIEGIEIRCVDVAEDIAPDVLCAELLSQRRPGRVVLRDGCRYAAELGTLDSGTFQHSPVIDPQAVHVITGGLGGLGLEVAKHLARTRPGVRIALLSRGATPGRDRSPDTRQAALREMEASGAHVRCYQGDVADKADMERAVAAIRRDLGRIGCVVHAAGVAGDGFIFRKERDVFRRTVAPKILGTTILDGVTADDPPDLMVLFGSTTALLGAAGQSDYTAANSYLDGYADYRNARGRRTIVIHWTDWLEIGMAADHGVEPDQGFFRSVTAEDGIGSFAEILDSGHSRVVVGEINYEMLRDLDTLHGEMDRAPLVLSPAIRHAIRSAHGKAGKAPANPPQVSAPTVTPAGRADGHYSATERQLAQIWGRELGLDELNIYENSFDLGGNSLMALRIAQAIQRTMGARVRLADLFQYVTVVELAEYVDGAGS